MGPPSFAELWLLLMITWGLGYMNGYSRKARLETKKRNE